MVKSSTSGQRKLKNKKTTSEEKSLKINKKQIEINNNNNNNNIEKTNTLMHDKKKLPKPKLQRKAKKAIQAKHIKTHTNNNNNTNNNTSSSNNNNNNNKDIKQKAKQTLHLNKPRRVSQKVIKQQIHKIQKIEKVKEIQIQKPHLTAAEARMEAAKADLNIFDEVNNISTFISNPFETISTHLSETMNFLQAQTPDVGRRKE